MKIQARTMINQAKMLKCLVLHQGVVRKACITANVSKSTFYNWCASYPEYKDQVMNVYKRIGNYAAIRLIAKQIGNDEKQLQNIFSSIKIKTQVVV